MTLLNSILILSTSLPYGLLRLLSCDEPSIFIRPDSSVVGYGAFPRVPFCARKRLSLVLTGLFSIQGPTFQLTNPADKYVAASVICLAD